MMPNQIKSSKLLERLSQFCREHGRIGALGGWSVGVPVIGGATLLGAIHRVGPWLQANEVFGFTFFVLLMTIFAGLALLPTNVLGIVSGWAFNFPIGLAAMVIGICGAATLTYFIARRLSGDRLQSIIERKPKAKALRRALLQENLAQTIFIIILLRLSPAMPFSMTNFLMAATNVPLPIFLVGTVFGMLPRSAAVVYFGSELSELNFSQPNELWMILPGIAATILAVGAIGFISKRALSKYIQENESPAI
jgi:uncharacterized membrane protein YdjX (TVP38/TMEM64 family)